MSKVLTFSRVFPSYHPRKGERTFFIEKIVEGMLAMGTFEVSDETLALCGLDGDYTKYDVANIKYHTIRAGKRWKVGDKFSPRVWSGKPYASKQIIIAHDIEVKKVWDFEMDLNGIYSINGKYILTEEDDDVEILLAKNDGLDPTDFFKWFMPNYNKPKEFSGQIICWNENINY